MFPVNTFENEVSRDSRINSLKQPTHTQYININSKYRNTSLYSISTDFQVTLPSESKRVIELEVADIQIPADAYYMFSNAVNNNVFWVCISTIMIETEPYKIIIPDGNYTVQELVTVVNDIFLAIATNTTLTTDDPNLALLQFVTFTVNTRDMKSSFAINYDANIYFSVIFYDLTMNILPVDTFGWRMGFLSPFYAYFNGNSTLAYGNINGEMASNILNYRNCFLSVNDFQYNNNSNNVVVLNGNSALDDYVAAKCSIPVVFDDTKLNLVSFQRKYNGPINLKKIHVKLYDENGKIVFLNGVDFAFTIKLTIAYDI
jgi:hypothetical protein